MMENTLVHHNEIRRLIGGSSVDYLDIPCHENIGDLLIFLGTLKFLAKHQVEISRMQPFLTAQPTERGDSIILLHGGGNLGDIYPHHQKFREDIIRRNHHRRIIVLPQSIYFKSIKKFDEARRVFNRHPDLHLFVRDQTSLELAKHLSINAILCPDMAHQLYPIGANAPRIAGKELYLIRRDAESKWGSQPKPSKLSTLDWPDITPKHYVVRRKLSMFMAKTGWPPLLGLVPRTIIFNSIRLQEKAATLFANYNLIHTDRLHGHILACLMNIPSTVIDNSYGKNHSYINAWTSASPLVSLA